MNLQKDSTITEECEEIAIIKFVNGEQLKIMCSDFYCNDDDNYIFEDRYGHICAIAPKEQVVYICEEKCIYK